jgi:ligand-binding sensor domain-containing protein/signal transduction histidine kinase
MQIARSFLSWAGMRAAGRMVLALTLAACGPACALQPGRPLREFGQRVWQTDDGLPQNTVNCILQTHDGYLWMGTEGGLARWDGATFTVFSRSTTPALRSDAIHALLEDGSGTLWVGTADGLSRLRDGVWATLTTRDGLPDNQIEMLHAEARGVVWVVTASGLAAVRKGVVHPVMRSEQAPEETVTALAGDAQGRLWIAGDLGLDRLEAGKRTRVDTHAINALAQGTDGVLWVASAQGLERVEQARVENVPWAAALRNTEITALLASRSGELWVGTEQGLYAWDGAKLRRYTTREGLPGDAIHKIYQDREGAVWVSTERGLARLVGDRVEALTPKEGLSAPLVLSWFEDAEGSLWLGTDAGGVTMLRDEIFTAYTAANGLPEENVHAILAAADGTVWLGTDGGGLVHMHAGRLDVFDTRNGLASNVVLSLAADAQGGLWVGTPDGLNHMQKDGQLQRITSSEGIADDYVRSLLVGRDGSLWIGTRHGLSHWSAGRVQNYTEADGLSSDFIGALAEDAAGNLWVGTLAGLDVVLRGQSQPVHRSVAGAGSAITALHADAQGNLWIASQGAGLRRLRGEAVFDYSSLRAMPRNIYGFAEDDAGNLWISSDHGVYRASLQALNAYAEGRSRGVELPGYGVADGMPTSQCNSGGHPEVSRSSDGRLWFATPRGIASIDPATAAYNRVPPPVVIEQVRVDDVEMNAARSFSVAPGHARYSFRYAGLSYIAPQRVRYRYRLDGFDPAWIDAGTQRQAEYTNLRPGRYTFRVIAENNDGVWNQTGAAVSFRVQPHVYQTVWFALALLGALLLAAYAVYRLRVLQMQAQFRAVLAERSRIAREIHDTLAQGFVGISLQLETARRLLAGANHAAVEQVEHALALTVSSLQEARRSIWDLRAEGQETASVPARLAEMVQQARKKSNAEITIDVHGSYRPMPEALAQELVRIAQEALSNAVRHSGAKTIAVELRYEPASVQLRVSDDGSGFTPQRAAQARVGGHFGLTGMEERARLIGARLDVRSESTGTVLTCTAPLQTENRSEKAAEG